MDRQDQINNLISAGIRAGLFLPQRQPRLVVPRIASQEQWQQAQEEALAKRKYWKQLFGIKGDAK